MKKLRNLFIYFYRLSIIHDTLVLVFHSRVFRLRTVSRVFRKSKKEIYKEHVRRLISTHF